MFPFERQLDKMDCGPACLKIISKFYKKFYTLQYLRDKCGISKQGINLNGLSAGANAIGFKTLKLEITFNDLIEKIPLPCIIHWDNSHFIVVYKTTSKRVYVSDPAKGLLSYSHREFNDRWSKSNGSGVVLVIEPSSDFDLTTDEIRKQKHKYSYVFRYLKPYKKAFVSLFVVMFIVTCLQGLLPFISKAVIDVGIQTHDLDFIHIVLIANIVIIVSVTLSNVVRDWVLMHITARVNISLISEYLIKLMKLPITFFETKLTGDLLQRANDLERIRSFIMNNSISLIFSSLTFVVFGIILWVYNAFIFYIFFIGSVVYVCWVLAFLRIRKKLDWQYFDLVSQNQSYWVETIESIQDIKINNYETFRRWKWEKIQAKLYKVNVRSLTVNSFQNLGAQFFDQMKNLLITFFCAKAVISGEITFGVMISTQFIIGMLNAPVNQFIQFIVQGQAAQISFQRLNEIHGLEDEEADTEKTPVVLHKDKSLLLYNVGFQYTSMSPPVLRNINLIIPHGKITAIVGDSGSGKSTLLKLILRLYKPSFGDILVGGANINNLTLEQWRTKCGVVMQDGKIFNDTILNNIVMNDDEVDYERLKYAIDTANIAYEIDVLPKGLQTMMGEMGRGLSGGQKQRLLIARALYKNPDYLFLDEATNSLDTINEQKIVSALEQAFQNKTVVVIAHRLSTIRKADQIIVMQNGTIIEAGNHDTLIEKRGRYYQLIQSQLDEHKLETGISIASS